VPLSLWRLGTLVAVLVCIGVGGVQAADSGPHHHADGACDATTGTYEVVKGDDLDAIAERFGVTVTELKEENKLGSSEIEIEIEIGHGW